jgi:hypothetical protein
MARKREKIREKIPQPTPQQIAYWNATLSRKGLSVDAGRSARLLYIGSGSDVELIEGLTRTSSGRVKPKKGAE